MDPEAARRDFQDRLKQYESIYEPVDEVLDKDIPYIKLYNVASTAISLWIGGPASESQSVQRRFGVGCDFLSAQCAYPASQDLAVHPRRDR